MRRLVITEDYGLFTAETSDGKRVTGMTLARTLAKLLPLAQQPQPGDEVEAIFDAIYPTQVGQIRDGVQGT